MVGQSSFCCVTPDWDLIRHSFPELNLQFIQIFDCLVCTIGAETVREEDIDMVADISFQLIPVAFVIADLLACGTDGEHAAQGSDPGECVSQLNNEAFSFLL